MVEAIINSFYKISKSIAFLDERLGFKKILKYSLFVTVMFAIFNIREVIKSTIEFVDELNEEIHSAKMGKRDELLAKLYPTLVEMRSSTNADRLLYFEYHNSKENLVGIPFKYIDLVMQTTKYGVHKCPSGMLHDINVGNITSLYDHLRQDPNSVVFCSGARDYAFINAYPGIEEIFSPQATEIKQDYRLAFVSIPGIEQPIGLIVLEWFDPEEDEYDPSKIKTIVNQEISRINALILSKR